MANYRKTYFCICDGQHGDTICYDNPDLSIDIFLKMVLVDSGDW